MNDAIMLHGGDNSKIVNFDQAKAFAKRLRREGKSYAAVAYALKNTGYVSSRTGRPLTFGGIQGLVKYKKRGRYTKKNNASEVAAPTKSAKKTIEHALFANAINSIYDMKHINSDTKLAMIHLLVNE